MLVNRVCHFGLFVVAPITIDAGQHFFVDNVCLNFLTREEDQNFTGLLSLLSSPRIALVVAFKIDDILVSILYFLYRH